MENPHGRNLVEAGNLCERKNGRGVDSNRNWPVDWGTKEADYDPYEEYPGTKPFRCVLSGLFPQAQKVIVPPFSSHSFSARLLEAKQMYLH